MQQGADCFLPGLDVVAGACDFFGPIKVEIIIGFMVTEVEATFEMHVVGKLIRPMLPQAEYACISMVQQTEGL